MLHVPSDLSRVTSSDILIGIGLLEETVISHLYSTIRCCVLIRFFFFYFHSAMFRLERLRSITKLNTELYHIMISRASFLVSNVIK